MIDCHITANGCGMNSTAVEIGRKYAKENLQTVRAGAIGERLSGGSIIVVATFV